MVKFTPLILVARNSKVGIQKQTEYVGRKDEQYILLSLTRSRGVGFSEDMVENACGWEKKVKEKQAWAKEGT